MSIIKSRLRLILLIAVLILPLASWTFFKPIRVLAPELNGVTCITNNICVENLSKKEDAKLLYEKSLNFINNYIGKIENNPRVIFCSSISCFKSFGFHFPAKAKTVGYFGIVIGPKGWLEIFMRHEMIHYLQVEQLGLYSYVRAPQWFKEGMAYSLSKDPRELKKPWSEYRKKFRHWYNRIDKRNLWSEAGNL